MQTQMSEMFFIMLSLLWWNDMEKIFIRTLWNDGARPLWISDHQRGDLKLKLNDLGFYVLNGPMDSLEVYAFDFYEPIDVRIATRLLDKALRLFRKRGPYVRG